MPKIKSKGIASVVCRVWDLSSDRIRLYVKETGEWKMFPSISKARTWALSNGYEGIKVRCV